MDDDALLKNALSTGTREGVLREWHLKLNCQCHNVRSNASDIFLNRLQKLVKRHLAKFSKRVVPIVSVLVFILAGWLWHRSFHVADYCYRLVPEPGGCALRGFGSYRGAIVLASVIDPIPRENSTRYRMETFAMGNGGGGGDSMLKPIPSFYVKALGFGVSHGQLTLNLPLAWMLPIRTYHAFYVPYYFIMLLAGILPMRWAWRYRSRRRVVV